MAQVLLSKAEKAFIIHGVQDNIRTDGRKCEDYRTMDLETDIVSNSAGSARLRLANTDVLVGVKAEIGEPKLDRPNEGYVEFFVDCSANAAPEFEGRGGEDLGTLISSTLARAYNNPRCLDLASLSIVPHKQCWVVYVDILLLQCGGNLFDAVSFAVKAALYNTRIPTLSVTSSEQGLTEIEVSDDPYDCQRLDIKYVPCLVTLSKIGDSHIVDSTIEEETCVSARLLIGVTVDGMITTVKKDGGGSLKPATISKMMETGRRVGQVINERVMKALQEEEAMPPPLSRHASGFLR